MIDDVTMHATLTSYSLTVMCHFKKNNNNAKYLRFYCREVESSRNSKLRGLSGRFQTLIWRQGDTVQNLESPGLSGRVDSPAKAFSKSTKSNIPGMFSFTVNSITSKIDFTASFMNLHFTYPD